MKSKGKPLKKKSKSVEAVPVVSPADELKRLRARVEELQGELQRKSQLVAEQLESESLASRTVSQLENELKEYGNATVIFAT